MTSVNELNTKITERSRMRAELCDVIKSKGKEIDGVMYVPVKEVLPIFHGDSKVTS